jgi:large subunit ribosomal protein L6
MIIGVVEGFKKKLLLNGLGYRANIENKNIALSIGFSHTVYKQIPEGLNVNILDQNKTIEILGISKELVGLFASQIRNIRPPEPYLGKGIQYSYEKIIKKQGKTNIK